MARKLKDSGIEWIGEIPEDWEISKLKYAILKVGSGKTPYGGAESYTKSGIIFLRSQNIYDTGIILEPITYISTETDAEMQNTRVYPHDVLLNITGGSIGRCCIFPSELKQANVNQHVSIIRVNPKLILPEYMHYFWICSLGKNAINLYQTGGNREGMSAEAIKNTPIPRIPLILQMSITHYLDDKCKKIDSIITKTRTSIEEYKKLKQSLITQAVTKGIRPNRKMKDSGIEWIGEIPEDWRMERGKGLFEETNTRSRDGIEELLTVSQYTGITPRSQKDVNMFEAETLEGYKICEIGDIAANTMWLWAGAIGVSQYRGIISPSYNIYRQTRSAYAPQYLDYLLRSTSLVQHFESISTGIRASRLRLYPQQFLGIYFPVPPMREQDEIASYLCDKIHGINTLIAKKEQLLIELENYKKSLIFEYVTGKKEVPVA